MKHRVQFDFTEEALQRLDAMKEQTQAETRAEVLRKALRVYEWFLQVKPEQIIEIQEPNGEIVYRIPGKTLLS